MKSLTRILDDSQLPARVAKEHNPPRRDPGASPGTPRHRRSSGNVRDPRDASAANHRGSTAQRTRGPEPAQASVDEAIHRGPIGRREIDRMPDNKLQPSLGDVAPCMKNVRSSPQYLRRARLPTVQTLR